MRNNAVKQYPKEFSKAFSILDESLEEAEKVVNNSISDNADFIVAEVNENPNTTFVNQQQVEQAQEEQTASVKVDPITAEIIEDTSEDKSNKVIDKFINKNEEQKQEINNDWMN